MPNIPLHPITIQNWRECIRLQVRDDQTDFVASNAKSLAQAAYETNWRPYGIYNTDTMVGFVMFGLETYQGDDFWVIIRLMVDQQHQGKGYATATITTVLAMMQAENNNIPVYISFVPENIGAGNLYRKLGFEDAGKTPDGSETLMVKKF